MKIRCCPARSPPHPLRFNASISAVGSGGSGSACFTSATCASGRCLTSFCCSSNVGSYCTSCSSIGLCLACGPGASLINSACVVNNAFLAFSGNMTCDPSAAAIDATVVGALYAASGTISTYSSVDCASVITAPAGSRVVLNVTRFNMPCTLFNEFPAGHGLYFYDGPSTSSRPLGFLCYTFSGGSGYLVVGSSNVLTARIKYNTPPSYLVLTASGDNGCVPVAGDLPCAVEGLLVSKSPPTTAAPYSVVVE
jgi:hypothetical protein